jgi:hypothetical protein
LQRFLKVFIEGQLFHDKRRNLNVTKSFFSILLHEVLMAFIEWELFHDKRRNSTVYERYLVDFIGTVA